MWFFPLPSALGMVGWDIWEAPSGDARGMGPGSGKKEGRGWGVIQGSGRGRRTQGWGRRTQGSGRKEPGLGGVTPAVLSRETWQWQVQAGETASAEARAGPMPSRWARQWQD